MKAKDSSVKLVASAAIGVAMALGALTASATTYKIKSGDVAALTNALYNGTSASGSIIELEPGVYDLTGLRTNMSSCSSHLITYAKYFSIRGKNAKHWGEKTPAEETILRGDGTLAIFHIVSGAGRKTSFHHLTFENGNCTTSGSQGGGAISCVQTEQFNFANGYQLATNCVFRNCRSSVSNGGGGTYFINAYDCLYTNCWAKNGGGAVGSCGNNGGTTYRTNEFVNCVFVDCSATNGAGGGVHLVCNDRIVGCKFINCLSKDKDNDDSIGGGAVYLKTGSRLIDGCSFVGCSACYGGAVYSNGKLGTVKNCSFTNNVANYRAGVALNTPSGDFEDCTFNCNSNKVASSIGAHLYRARSAVRCSFTGHGDSVCAQYDRCTFSDCRFPSPKGSYHDGMLQFSADYLNADEPWFIRNSLFMNNIAGIIVYNNSYKAMTVDNCTFVSNMVCKGVSEHEGYIIYTMRGTPPDEEKTYGGTNLVANCIFWNNYQQQTNRIVRRDASFYLTANTTSGVKAYNSVSNSIYGSGVSGDITARYDFNQVSDPGFAKDASRYAGRPFYSLRAGSPARERGKRLDWMDAATSTDLSGNPRIVGTLPDIGCYEYQPLNLGLMLLVR